MRKILKRLAPKSRIDLTRKSIGFCVCIAAWHFVFTRYVLGDVAHSLNLIALEVFAVGGPFVLLFMFGSWQQVKAIQALTRRAYYDQLSHLLNRQTFISRLKKVLPKSTRGILMLIDADHFKQINDQYGHAAGDLCIEAIGHRLNWHVRDNDLSGRVGGEEFAVFLPDVSKEHGKAVAQRLGLPVSFSVADNQTHLTVTLSIGAVWTSPDQSVEQLLISADDALYVAKSSGRAQLRFSDGGSGILLSSLEMQSEATADTLGHQSNSKIRMIS